MAPPDYEEHAGNCMHDVTLLSSQMQLCARQCALQIICSIIAMKRSTLQVDLPPIFQGSFDVMLRQSASAAQDAVHAILTKTSANQQCLVASQQVRAHMRMARHQDAPTITWCGEHLAQHFFLAARRVGFQSLSTDHDNNMQLSL